MKVLYFATLRSATGKTEEDWPQPAATIGELVQTLAARYGPKFGAWVLDRGELSQLALILVNGRDVRELQGPATRLSIEDTVSMIPPVGGG
jgi:molybdopterin synthase sulfur carrier subunit